MWTAMWVLGIKPGSPRRAASTLFLKFILVFICINVYLHVCLCTTCIPGAHRGQKRTLDALSRGTDGSEPGPSGRAATAVLLTTNPPLADIIICAPASTVSMTLHLSVKNVFPAQTCISSENGPHPLCAGPLSAWNTRSLEILAKWKAEWLNQQEWLNKQIHPSLQLPAGITSESVYLSPGTPCIWEPQTTTLIIHYNCDGLGASEKPSHNRCLVNQNRSFFLSHEKEGKTSMLCHLLPRMATLVLAIGSAIPPWRKEEWIMKGVFQYK